MHGEIDERGVVWQQCRECSKAASTPELKRKVFHRWSLKVWPPVRLKDVTFNDRGSSVTD